MVPTASFMTERAVGFIGFKGATTRASAPYHNAEQLMTAPFLEVPGLFVLAEHDADAILQSTQVTADGRALGARWALVFEVGGRHNAVGSTTDITIPFVETLLDLRIPSETDVAAGPVPLTPLSEESGWLGHLTHHRIWKDGIDDGYEIIDDIAIAPADAPDDDAKSANWLPSEAFADTWLAYQKPEK